MCSDEVVFYFHSDDPLDSPSRNSTSSAIKMTPPSLNESSSILIVGAGTWGCSTALHLVRRGYKNVTVLDPYPVPSSIAAGNDVNKIMEHKELKGTNDQTKT